jgi:hypothetical protein
MKTRSPLQGRSPSGNRLSSDGFRLLPSESPETGVYENYDAFTEFTTITGMNRTVETGMCV